LVVDLDKAIFCTNILSQLEYALGRTLGGASAYMLFQFSSMGRVQQSLDALVDGISEVLRKSGGNGERLLPWVSGEERLVEVVSRCFLQV